MLEFKEEVELLYLEWQVHDGKDCRYAAMLHLLKIWLWDANGKNGNKNEDENKDENENAFPTELMLRLIGMIRSKDHITRAMAFCSVVLIVMRFDTILPGEVQDAIRALYDVPEVMDEMVEVQQFFLTSVISLKVKKEVNDKISGLLTKQETTRGKLGIEEMQKKVSEMLEDGVDMNQGTFVVMSQNNFFKNLRNWLIEFDMNNPALNSEKNQSALAMFSAMTNLCDVDKYALALTMSKMDGVKLLIENLPDGFVDSFDTERMKKDMKGYEDKYAYMRSFQTLYRLFRLSPWRKQLKDPFENGPFMADFGLLLPLTQSEAFYKRMAGLFSRHEFYAHAAYYSRIMLRKKKQDKEEKEEMLTILALCDKHLGENKERLKCLLKLEKMRPDDLDIAAETGLSLIIEKRYEEALERFFHMEVMERCTRRSTRAIAWCSLLTGNFSRSERYYKKLLSWNGGPSWEDLLNSGHSAWLSGDPVRASQLYSRYQELHKDNMLAFDCDTPQLKELGLLDDDIALMKSTVMD